MWFNIQRRYICPSSLQFYYLTHSHFICISVDWEAFTREKGKKLAELWAPKFSFVQIETFRWYRSQRTCRECWVSSSSLVRRLGNFTSEHWSLDYLMEDQEGGGEMAAMPQLGIPTGVTRCLPGSTASALRPRNRLLVTRLFKKLLYKTEIYIDAKDS